MLHIKCSDVLTIFLIIWQLREWCGKLACAASVIAQSMTLQAQASELAVAASVIAQSMSLQAQASVASDEVVPVQAQAFVASAQVALVHVESSQHDTFDNDPDSVWMHSGGGTDAFFVDDEQ